VQLIPAGAPTAFEVTYYCSPTNFRPSAYITVVVDLCAPDTDPKQCDAQHHDSIYAPLRFECVAARSLRERAAAADGWRGGAVVDRPPADAPQHTATRTTDNGMIPHHSACVYSVLGCT
jgi:hypothetical protein